MKIEQCSYDKVFLTELVDINVGKTPARKNPKNFGSGFPWISIADLKGDKYIYKTKEELTKLGIESSGIKIVPSNTLLFSFKLSIGKVSITGKEMYTNEAIAAFPIKNNALLDLSYFYFVMRCVDYSDLGSRAVLGNTLNKEKLKKIKIPLPPLEEQKKIAAILDNADKIRQINKDLIKKYDELSQSLFIDMFGDPVTNPMGWDRKNFGDYIDVLTDYHSNGSYKVLREHVELKNELDFALMVRTTDLEKNNFENDVVCISESAYNYLEKTKIFGGELIMNKIGSAGKTYLMPNLNRPVSLGMNAFLLRFTDFVNSLYIFFLLNTKYGENEIKKRIKGAVTKTIRKDAVREIMIPVPPIELQEEFAKRIKEIEKQKAIAEESLSKSEDLFNALMQKAFKGELTQA